MPWVETPDYLGLERRGKPRLRLIERRARSFALDPPSLGQLLRRLVIWARDVKPADADSLARYCARLEAAAKLAGARGHGELAALLGALEHELRSTPHIDVPETSRARLHEALASL